MSDGQLNAHVPLFETERLFGPVPEARAGRMVHVREADRIFGGRLDRPGCLKSEAMNRHGIGGTIAGEPVLPSAEDEAAAGDPVGEGHEWETGQPGGILRRYRLSVR